MLKTYAATYVSLQENLSDDEKISIIKWIKESNKDEIKNLLVTGSFDIKEGSSEKFDNSFIGQYINEISPETLKAMGLQGTLGGIPGGPRTGIVDMNKLVGYINDKVSQATQVGHQAGIHAGEVHAMKGFAAGAITALVLAASFDLYKRFLSKAARACKNFSGDQKTSCMNKYKRDAQKKQVNDLTIGLKACNKAKDPMKCRHKIENKIRKLKTQLGAL